MLLANQNWGNILGEWGRVGRVRVMFDYVNFLHFDFRGIWGTISNGNRTERSTIRGVIGLLISKPI